MVEMLSLERNALLRIASCMAWDNEWMAEHMLILGLEDQKVKKLMWRGHSRCLWKDQYGHADSTDSMKGWKVSTVGDDIAWLKPDEEGMLGDQSRGSAFLELLRGHPGRPTQMQWSP